jgi:hypothetical protein
LCGHDSTKIVNSGSETFFAETTYVATASTMTIGIFLARLAGTGTASLTGTRELYIQDIGAL